VLWNRGLQTDREVLANRPDIIVGNTKDRTCLLTDVATPSERNVIKRRLNGIKTQKSKQAYKNSANVEYEKLCYNGDHWIHRAVLVKV
jgi:hypothetical protein